MIVDFSIAPIGKGESLSSSVAEAFAIIERIPWAPISKATGTRLWPLSRLVATNCWRHPIACLCPSRLMIAREPLIALLTRCILRRLRCLTHPTQNPRDEQTQQIARFDIFGTACRLTPIHKQPFRQGASFSTWPVGKTRSSSFPTSPSPVS